VRFKDHRPKGQPRTRWLGNFWKNAKKENRVGKKSKRKDYERKEKTGDFSSIKIYKMETTLCGGRGWQQSRYNF
jgi:hypothetical protein